MLVLHKSLLLRSLSNTLCLIPRCLIQAENVCCHLWSDGSIGTGALDVVRSLGDPWRVVALSAHRQLKEAVATTQSTRPKYFAATCTKSAEQFDFSAVPAGPKSQGSRCLNSVGYMFRSGHRGCGRRGNQLGCLSTVAAAEAGKRLALANKEALVVAGGIVTEALRKSGGELIPVDSEQVQFFRRFMLVPPKQVQRIILTASGGPFRTWSKEKLASATISDALAHPTWQMGRKITIDSAR